MTKKENEVMEKLLVVMTKNLEMQTQILGMLNQVNSPVLYTGSDQNPAASAGEMPKPNPLEIPIETKPAAPATDMKPFIPEPPADKEYTIEQCREVLGKMVSKFGEDEARQYLAKFDGATMLPDLDKKHYKTLVENGLSLLGVEQ